MFLPVAFVRERFSGVYLCRYKLNPTVGDLSLHQKLYFYLICYNVIFIKYNYKKRENDRTAKKDFSKQT